MNLKIISATIDREAKQANFILEVEDDSNEVVFEENAKEYATQMMGIGEYSERWHIGDKSMWTALMKAYKQAQRVGYQLAKDEIPDMVVYREVKFNERLPVQSGWYVIKIIIGKDYSFVSDYFTESGFSISGDENKWLEPTTLKELIKGGK